MFPRQRRPKLSGKQQQILSFIHRYFQEKDCPPTIRDILKGCSLSSTSVVDYNLRILEKQGCIRRSPDISRGIALPERKRKVVLVPLLGRIAAGLPIPVPHSDAWHNPAQEMLEVPQDLTAGREDVYALRVKGNSMVDALVANGDIVLVQSLSVAQDGDIAVIWLKEEKEVTLKKIYHEKGRLRLQPANSQMKPLYTQPENVQVQGKVIGVIRRTG